MKTLFTYQEWDSAKNFPGLIRLDTKKDGKWIPAYIFKLRDRLAYPRIHLEVVERTADFINVSSHIDWVKHDRSSSEDPILRAFAKRLKNYHLEKGQDNGHQ